MKISDFPPFGRTLWKLIDGPVPVNRHIYMNNNCKPSILKIDSAPYSPPIQTETKSPPKKSVKFSDWNDADADSYEEEDDQQ